MTSLTLERRGSFSIVSLGQGDDATDWAAMLGLSAAPRTYLDVSAATAGQRNLWAARLDETVMKADRAVLLLANGAGCAAAAWWARLSPRPYVSRVAGAILHSPLDAGDHAADGIFASPSMALPFPSIVLDEGGAIDPQRLGRIASGWGSQVVERQPAAAWHHARRLFERWSAGVVERDLRIASTFGVDS